MSINYPLEKNLFAPARLAPADAIVSPTRTVDARNGLRADLSAARSRLLASEGPAGYFRYYVAARLIASAL